MTTAEQSEALYASELQVLSQAAEALDEVQTRIGPRFRRAETRRRVRRFLEACSHPSSARTAGNWPKLQASVVPMACNGCSWRPTGIRRRCVTSYAPTSWDIWERKQASWWWMRRAFSKRARSRQVWRGSTVGRRVAARTARSASFCCTPGGREPPSSIGNCIFPRSGRLIVCAAGKLAFPREWALPPKGNSPERCWHVLLQPGCGLRGWWGTPSTALMSYAPG